MALQKQTLNVALFKGVDTKTDPKQVMPGKLLALENGIFQTPGKITKRNGFQELASIDNATGLSNFQDELIALTSTSLLSYDSGIKTLIEKGPLAFCDVSLRSIIANQYQQTVQDMSINPLGIKVISWEDSSGGSRYSVIDTNTGNQLVSNALISSTAVMPKSIVFNDITFLFYIDTATNHLTYSYIAVASPTILSTPVQVVTVSASNRVYDIGVINAKLFFTYLDGTDVVSLNFITPAFSVPPIPAQPGDTSVGPLTLFIDSVTAEIYVAYYTGTAVKIFAYGYSMNQTMAPTVVETVSNIHNLTGAVSNTIGKLYYEISATPTYNALIRNAGLSSHVVGSPSVFIRSLGLGAKAFFQNGMIYVFGMYDSGLGQQLSTESGAPQNKYILLDSNAVAVGKLLSEPNTAGSFAARKTLPFVSTLDGINYSLPVLINTPTSGFAFELNQTLGEISLQFGVRPTKVELGDNLHIAAGALLFMYDGRSVVEHGFNFYPEKPSTSNSGSGGGLNAGVRSYTITYEWNDNQGQLHRSATSTPITDDTTLVTSTPITFQAVFSSGDTSFTASSTTGLFIGQVITDSTTPGNITAGTKITNIQGSTVTIDTPAAGNSAGSPGDILSTNYTLSTTLTIPTLRVTSKTGVNIVIYRTLNDEITYFRVGSVANNPAVDTVSFVDTTSDYEASFNETVYTTGGVLDNIAVPATRIITQYQNRLIAVPAENRYQIMYSKQTGRSVGSALLAPVQFAADAFYINVDQRGGELSALSPMDDKLMMFKENSIFFLYGQGPAPNGVNNDFSTPQFVTTDVGCTDTDSLVIMPLGLMFKSNKGIYLLSRALVHTYIGASVERYNAANITSANLVPNTNQVRFTLDSRVILSYDYFVNEWSVFTKLNAADSVIFDNLHTFLDNNLDRIMQEEIGTYDDAGDAIAIKITTSWLSFVGIQGFQRVYKMLLLGDYYSPHSLIISLAYDFNGSVSQTIPVNTQSYTQYPYGSDYAYGDVSPEGGQSPGQYQFNVMPQVQKCQTIQVTIQEYPTMPYGQGLSLSDMTFEVGAKKGPYKLPASRNVG